MSSSPAIYAQHRALAAARRPDNDDKFLFGNVQTEIVHCLFAVRIDFFEMFQAQKNILFRFLLNNLITHQPFNPVDAIPSIILFCVMTNTMIMGISENTPVAMETPTCPQPEPPV